MRLLVEALFRKANVRHETVLRDRHHAGRVSDLLQACLGLGQAVTGTRVTICKRRGRTSRVLRFCITGKRPSLQMRIRFDNSYTTSL